MLCIRCGTRTEGDGKFCPNCGTKFVMAPNAQESDISPSNISVSESEQLEEIQDTIIISGFLSAFYRVIVLCIGICTILEIILVLNGSFDSFHLKVLKTTIFFSAFGLLNINYSKLYKKRNYSFLSIIGMFFSSIYFIAYLLSMWEIVNIDSKIIIKILTSMIVISVAIYHVSFVLTIDFKNELAKIFSSIAKLLIGITYSLIIVYIFTSIYNVFYLKGFLVLIILTIFASIATRLLNES